MDIRKSEPTREIYDKKCMEDGESDNTGYRSTTSSGVTKHRIMCSHRRVIGTIENVIGREEGRVAAITRGARWSRMEYPSGRGVNLSRKHTSGMTPSAHLRTEG